MRTTGDGERRHGANEGQAMAQVFHADGEKASTSVIEAVLSDLHAKVTHFDDTRDCLASLRTQGCDLLISNTKSPATEGVELVHDAKRIAPSVPIVVLVNHGDIQTAVRAMKGGAIDCLEHPLERTHLVSALGSALQESVPQVGPLSNPLSRTEEQVLHLILRGYTTAKVARKLNRSGRTIEVHRGHIMRKLQVEGMVDLAKKCAHLGFLRDWP